MAHTDYYENDDLIDHADFDGVEFTVDKPNGLTRHLGVTDRGKAAELVLPDSASTVSSYSGGYTGRYAIAIMYDGAYWLVTDAYGSCSHCDSFLADKQAATEQILRDAKRFESLHALCRWVRRMQARVWNGLYHQNTSQVVNDVIGQLVDERRSL